MTAPEQARGAAFDGRIAADGRSITAVAAAATEIADARSPAARAMVPRHRIAAWARGAALQR